MSKYLNSLRVDQQAYHWDLMSKMTPREQEHYLEFLDDQFLEKSRGSLYAAAMKDDSNSSNITPQDVAAISKMATRAREDLQTMYRRASVSSRSACRPSVPYGQQRAFKNSLAFFQSQEEADEAPVPSGPPSHAVGLRKEAAAPVLQKYPGDGSFNMPPGPLSLPGSQTTLWKKSLEVGAFGAGDQVSTDARLSDSSLIATNTSIDAELSRASTSMISEPTSSTIFQTLTSEGAGKMQENTQLSTPQLPSEKQEDAQTASSILSISAAPATTIAKPAPALQRKHSQAYPARLANFPSPEREHNSREVLPRSVQQAIFTHVPQPADEGDAEKKAKKGVFKRMFSRRNR